MIISPSSRCTSYIWQVERRKYNDDIRKIVKLCREYDKINKMLNLRITGDNAAFLYIQLINALERFGLFNITPIIKLNKLNAKAIAMISNKKFLAHYFKDILGGNDLCPDRETGKKSIELMKKLAPKQLKGFGSNDCIVATKYNGQLLKLSTNRKEWVSTKYPSFSINTRDGLLRVYLTDLKKNVYGRTINLNFDKLNNIIFRYYSQTFIYSAKVQKQFKSIRCNSMYLLPYKQKADIISLAEYEEYQNRYNYDDPSKGFGTRLFYYDEAEMIDTKLYPSGSNSFKVLTNISNEEVAIHKTPSSFIKKEIKDYQNYVSVMVRVPRVMIVERERFEQLINDSTIEMIG